MAFDFRNAKIDTKKIGNGFYSRITSGISITKILRVIDNRDMTSNWFLTKRIKGGIKPPLIICPECRGTEFKRDLNNEYVIYTMCDRCGAKKLDLYWNWFEIIKSKMTKPIQKEFDKYKNTLCNLG